MWFVPFGAAHFGVKVVKKLLTLAQSERKSASDAQFATQIDGFAVCLQDVFHNREAQACATLLARAPLVGAVETLKDSGYILFGNASAVVAHLDEHLVKQVYEFDGGAATLVAVADRVDYEVYEHLLDVVAVGLHPYGRVGLRRLFYL